MLSFATIFALGVSSPLVPRPLLADDLPESMLNISDYRALALAQNRSNTVSRSTIDDLECFCSDSESDSASECSFGSREDSGYESVSCDASLAIANTTETTSELESDDEDALCTSFTRLPPPTRSGERRADGRLLRLFALVNTCAEQDLLTDELDLSRIGQLFEEQGEFAQEAEESIIIEEEEEEHEPLFIDLSPLRSCPAPARSNETRSDSTLLRRFAHVNAAAEHELLTDDLDLSRFAAAWEEQCGTQITPVVETEIITAIVPSSLPSLFDEVAPFDALDSVCFAVLELDLSLSTFDPTLDLLNEKSPFDAFDSACFAMLELDFPLSTINPALDLLNEKSVFDAFDDVFLASLEPAFEIDDDEDDSILSEKARYQEADEEDDSAYLLDDATPFDDDDEEFDATFGLDD